MHKASNLTDITTRLRAALSEALAAYGTQRPGGLKGGMLLILDENHGVLSLSADTTEGKTLPLQVALALTLAQLEQATNPELSSVLTRCARLLERGRQLKTGELFNSDTVH